MYPGKDRSQTDYHIPRNIWALSITSLLMDISSEMVINILPLFLFNVLGVKTNIIGLIEGVAESTSSLLKVFSGRFSDKLRARKKLAVFGYSISALAKPFFYFANSWGTIAAVRWVDRVGKGIRTAPRDALIADSVKAEKRGFAFGFHRAADTFGAVLGLLIALIIVWLAQANAIQLGRTTFQTIVLVSIIPSILAVITLIFGAKDVQKTGEIESPNIAPTSLGKPFIVFMLIVGLFELGNASDAFLILRAQERGISVIGILGMLVLFNLIYSLLSTPAGILSDRLGRWRMIITGWLVYAAIYLGFGLANSALQIWLLFICYGIYYGLAYGTSKAIIADLVPEAMRGTAYGAYNALLGILDFPASLLAGILWQGFGNWSGFGASAPFLFGAAMAFMAVLMMVFWFPRVNRIDIA